MRPNPFSDLPKTNGELLPLSSNRRERRLLVQRAMLLIAVSIIGTSVSIQSQEMVFPTDIELSSTYHLSSADFSTTDTLVVEWSIVHNDTMQLSNLYLADNLPSTFSIICCSLKIDDVAIIHDFTGPIPHQTSPAYNTYRWIIDYPQAGDTLNQTLMPGQTLFLRYLVTCDSAATYYLPFHAFCGSGNGTGMFSVASPIELTVSPGSGINDQPNQHLPRDMNLSAVAYPNPFNSEVIIRFECSLVSPEPVALFIYDLSGRLVCQLGGEPSGNRAVFRWRPGGLLAGGVYFYSLKWGRFASSGKVTFLK